MKKILTAILFLNFCIINAQTIDYYPSQKKGISNEDYNKGKYFLENTYKQMKEHGNSCYADYWNIALAYAYMGQSSKEILELLTKSKIDNPTNFCIIANWAAKDKPIEESKLFEWLGQDFIALVSDCAGVTENAEEDLKLKDKSAYTGYNFELIMQLDEILTKDQAYRKEHGFINNSVLVGKQRILDSENEKAVADMIQQYGYPGKTAVGEEWRDIACLILVHANSLSIQERLLPIIAKEANNGELSKSIVRILVDKIQLKKTGKQIFGSQSGIPFEEEVIIREVERKFNL